jgi:hypothetical protein
MTEYLVWHEGLAPWRWNGPSAFAYLMDFFARRVSLDDPGPHPRDPGQPAPVRALLRRPRGRERRRPAGGGGLRRPPSATSSWPPPWIPDRRRLARAVLEQMLASGIDPRDPGAPPAAEVAPKARERKTSRRLRKK